MEEVKPHLEVWSSVNSGAVSYMSLNGAVTSLEGTFAECPFQSQTNKQRSSNLDLVLSLLKYSGK